MSDNKYIETEEKFMNDVDKNLQYQKGRADASKDFDNDKYSNDKKNNIFYRNGYEECWDLLRKKQEEVYN